MNRDPIQAFRLKAPWVMAQLRADFGLSEEQAAGIVGNLGHESAGFTTFQELRPRAGRGGWGWAQWTGRRRVAFEDYCRRNRLSPVSDKANYAWLFLELKGPEKKAIAALKKTRTLKDAVQTFERAYERAGVTAWGSRNDWANRALAAYRAAHGAGLVPPHNPNPASMTGRKEDMKALATPGFIAGALGLAGSIAVAAGYPALAATLSSPEAATLAVQAISVAGGIIALVSGALRGVGE
jgi:hypothetical protein